MSRKILIRFFIIFLIIFYAVQLEVLAYPDKKDYLESARPQGYSLEKFLTADSLAKDKLERRNVIEESLEDFSPDNIKQAQSEPINQECCKVKPYPITDNGVITKFSGQTSGNAEDASR
ncbi:MAG: hypothetical protein JW734_05915 [Candidatus Omnitrophica bacterium]|nr:hypothetical protein [Candidatus Omnitrophota bacterium]